MFNEVDKTDLYIDDLTGTYPIEYLEKQLTTGTSEGEGFASLALIDVDWLKEINKSFGYSAGNLVLKEFIQKLKGNLPKCDQIYRLSGLVFAILLPSQNTEQSVDMLLTIKNKIGTLEILNRETEIELHPCFTIGIVTFEFNENLPMVILLERANQALALAGSNGQGIEAYKDTHRKKKKILLVEDTEFIIHYIQSKLKSMDLDVLYAKDGEEGVRKGQIEQPDLMIIDLMLPKMDGFEVCRQIKGNSKTKDTKIIIMSARKSKEDVVRCYNLGVDDYIVKPFELNDFEHRIKRLL